MVLFFYYQDQWSYLNTIIKIPFTQIDSLFTTVPVPYPVNPKTLNNQPEVKQASEETKVDEQEVAVKTTSLPEAKLIISNQIFIPSTFLPDKLYKFLKEKLNFANPQYADMQRRGYSTWNTPRWIKNIEAINNGILIPVGFLSEIQSFASRNTLVLHVEDKQILTKPITFKTRITLKPEQQYITKKLLKHNRIVLEAKPAFGKTMVAALYCIKQRKQKTLIIVHTRALIHQWKKRIEDWFEVNKQDIGIMGENKWTIGERFTIASYQTLARHDLAEIKDTFGFVVIDECHHVPAQTFAKVIKGLAAKYALGLTATAYRKDKLERLMNFYIGPITKKKRAQLVERIGQDRFKLLIATGKVIGEGFDWPELTHLFLAFPSSWKGKLVQYVGRVQREWAGKERAFIYDYIDYEVPILRIMYFRRLRIYRSLGLIKEKMKNNRVAPVPQD